MNGSETARTSIAVLPFANLSPQSGDDYFSDGLTEELILRLTRLQGLRVVAWHSSSQFRGREQDLRAIHGELNVDVVLRGSVRRSAARVRVTAQLIDTGSGAYLWSEAFDRNLDDVVAIQEEIARAIVETLKLALNPRRETAPATRTKRVNMECYNLCLQGRFYAQGRTASGLRRSLDCYSAAIAADPESATAHAGLADAYSLLADYGIMHPREAMPRAEAAALCALKLNPDSAEANSALAFIRSVFHWKWEEGEALYRRAIELNPSYARARHWFAIDCLAPQKRFDEAEPQVDIARELDPLSLITHEGSPYLRMLRRDYTGCIRGLQEIGNLQGGFHKVFSGIGRALNLLGRFDEAIAMLEKAEATAAGIPNVISALGQTLAMAGRTDEAKRRLDQLHALAQAEHVSATCFAIVHLGFGEREKALEWLEIGCERREVPVMMIFAHPVYDPLRDDARFQALVRRMRFLL